MSDADIPRLEELIRELGERGCRVSVHYEPAIYKWTVIVDDNRCFTTENPSITLQRLLDEMEPQEERIFSGKRGDALEILIKSSYNFDHLKLTDIIVTLFNACRDLERRLYERTE